MSTTFWCFNSVKNQIKHFLQTLNILKTLKTLHMKNNFIYPGFYENPDKSSDEKREIYKVLGPSEREGYWKTSDVNVELSEYELLNSFVRLDIQPKQEAQSKNKSRLFADFEEIPLQTLQTPIYHDQKPEETIHRVVIDDSISNIRVDNHIGADVIIPNPLSKDLEIIERLNIDACNAESFEKFGDSTILDSKPIINIEFETELNYNIDKLRTTIKLLNLDKTVIAEYLTKKIIEDQDIEYLIMEKVLEILDGEASVNQLEVLNGAKINKFVTDIVDKIEPIIVPVVPIETQSVPIETVNLQMGIDVLSEKLSKYFDL